MLAFTKGGKTLVATNRGSDNVSIFELTASDPLFPGAWKETIVVDLTQKKKMTASFRPWPSTPDDPTADST